MKKTLLIAAALGTALMSQAQTYVEVNDWEYLSVIPAALAVDGQPRMLFYNYNTHDVVTVKNGNLQTETTLTYPVDSVDVEYEGTQYRVVVEAIRVEYINLNDGILDQDSYPVFTQSLFNNTADYEYLMPVVSGAYTKTSDWDENYTYGVPDCQQVVVKTTNGSVVGTIQAPDGYHFGAMYNELIDEGISYFELYSKVVKIGGNIYLLLGVVDNYNESLYAWYRIDSQTQSISLAQVSPMNVRPSVAERGQELVVELGDDTQAHELQVVDAQGRTVKRVPVQPGQREVRLGTADLGRGMNFINARNHGAAKIIVK